MRVLIVEDDEDFRISLVDLLLKLGFAVDSAEDALTALGKLQSADVMLTDISLSGMDGLELCGEAKRTFPHLGVIVMTGYDSPEKRREAERLGAAYYLAKPFERRDLLDCLAALKRSA